MRFVYIIVFIFISKPLFSQYSVYGKVYSNTLEALQDVRVKLEAEDKIWDTAKTDEKGQFSFEKVPSGTFFLTITKNGFSSFNEKVVMLNDNIQLNDIILTIENTVDEVELKAKKIKTTNKIGKKVLLIEDLVLEGASLNDAMAVVPGARIMNGDLFIRGNKVQVYVNNRLYNRSYSELQTSITSSDIEKIEVITNPSSKYSAEGTAGIINIILKKKQEKGVNADLLMILDYDKYPWHYVRGSGNYNLGKLNIRGLQNFFDVKTFERLTQDRNDVYYSTTRIFDWYRTRSQIGVDYFFDTKNSFSAQFQYDYTDSEENVDIDSLSKENNHNTRYQQFDKTKFKEYEAKLFYQREFEKKGHRLDVEGLYFLSDNSERINYEYSATYNSVRLGEEQNIRINIDYVNPLSEKAKFEVGGELFNSYLLEDFTIRNTVYDLDFKRNIAGIYGSYEYKGEKFNTTLGVRTELTHTKSITGEDLFDNDYIEFFPSVHFGYKLDKKNEIEFSYTRRIERPWIYLYEPIRGEFNNYKLLGSNTLKPQLTDNIELNYGFQTKKWYAGLGIYYRFIKDEIGSNRYLDDDASNTIVYQRLNMGDKNEYGVELIVNYDPFKWWHMSYTCNGYHYKRQGFINNGYDVIKDNRVDMQLNNTFNLSDDFKLMVNGNYSSPYDDFSGTFKSVGAVNLSLQKQFLDQRLSLSVLFRDLFNTSIQEYDQYRPLESYDIEYKENQQMTFSVKYKIASGKTSKSLKQKAREDNVTSGVGK